MVLDQAVKQWLIRRAPHRLDLEGPKLASATADRRGVDPPRCGPLPPGQRVMRSVAHRRQPNLARPGPPQQPAPADHLPRGAVGRLPWPGLAQLRRQRPPAGSRVFANQWADASDVFGAELPAALSPRGGQALVGQSQIWNANPPA